MERNICNACKLPILEQYLSKVLNKVWHNDCVKCTECQETLMDKCFSRNDQIYCKADFQRLFGAQCAGCGSSVTSSDMIRRVNDHIFHLKCLVCSGCNRQIETGEELFKTDDNKFLCKSDYESTRKKSVSESSPISDESEDKNTVSNGSDDEDGCNGKRRGPRTTIKAKQLETLKTAFSATPKPSRHIREKLAQETGLNMRVIQVWFQNRRSKERRLKQLSVLGGRRTGGRSNKQDLRSEQESLEGSTSDSVTASYQFYPPVTPNSIVSTMIDDFNSKRMELSMGMLNSRDGQIMKHEFNSMEIDPSNAFSFVDSLNHETNTVPAYINQHLIASSHLASAADVW